MRLRGRGLATYHCGAGLETDKDRVHQNYRQHRVTEERRIDQTADQIFADVVLKLAGVG
jgi:hypothetical protein